MSQGRAGHRPRDRDPLAGRGNVAVRQEMLRLRGHNITWLPPLLLLMAIAIADYNTTGEFRIISWIVLVPGIAAATCGIWGTAVFAVLAMALYTIVDSAWPHQFQAGLPDFILVATGGVLATLACVVRVRAERRALHMRDVTDTVRRTVLRPLPPRWGGLEHAGVYLTADAQARVGGDFYDIQPGPHGTRVLLGDVQGKGLGAVETASVLLGAFREAGYHEAELMTVADRLEDRMLRHREYTTALGRGDGDRFATAVLLGFPVDRTDVVDAVVFGHEAPLAVGPAACGRCRPAGAADRLPGPGPGPAAAVPGARRRRRDAAAGHRRGDRGPGPSRRLLPARRGPDPGGGRRSAGRGTGQAGRRRTGRDAAAQPGASGRRHHRLRRATRPRVSGRGPRRGRSRH
ncbi:hypothetical protein SHKM778_01350 [Streptomyces sp. KM77-8]|uniref:PPM-type phosphatase domain-containing protein n=1 Tax=Streptomyces haneummycinicus TaxID=3074435 RepID=A0AAT9H900_9ACTN